MRSAGSNIRACATWTLRLSLVWGVVTWLLVGFLGFFWAFGMGGSHPEEGIANLMFCLLLLPWLPPTLALWFLEGFNLAGPVHPRKVAVGMMLGYVLLSLLWFPLSFFGLTWASITNIVALCYVPYFMLLILWLPWLDAPSHYLGVAKSSSEMSILPEPEKALAQTARKAGPGGAQAENLSRQVPPMHKVEILDSKAEGDEHRVALDRVGALDAGVEVRGDVADPQWSFAPTVGRHESPSRVAIPASQATVNQAYLTMTSITLFDYLPRYDSYSARSLIPERSWLVVLAPGTQYVRVRMAAGAEAFIKANEQLTPAVGLTAGSESVEANLASAARKPSLLTGPARPIEPPDTLCSLASVRGQPLAWVPSIQHDRGEDLRTELGAVATVEWEGLFVHDLTARTETETWQVARQGNWTVDFFSLGDLLVRGEGGTEVRFKRSRRLFTAGIIFLGWIGPGTALQSPWGQRLELYSLDAWIWSKTRLTWLDASGSMLVSTVSQAKSSVVEISAAGWELPEDRLIPLVLAAKWVFLNHGYWVSD